MSVTLGGLTLAMSNLLAAAQQAWIPLAVGTYISGESEGIYTYRFNQENGEAELASVIAADNPSFLAISPDAKTIYAVDESALPDDSLTSFAYKAPGSLSPLGSMPVGGAAPCYVSAGCGLVVTANYTGGSLSVFGTMPDGSLGRLLQKFEFPLVGPAPDTVRQQSAHIHCAVFAPDRRHLLATDLGNDCIYTFALRYGSDEPLELIHTTHTAPGAGPRHLTFSPDGQRVYLVTELSGEVMTFRYDDGILSLLQTVECDEEHARASADIHLSPDGRFLYASNRRKNDGITIFRVNPESGLLDRVGRQPTRIHPRNFAITPNGKLLLCACRDSNAIQIFEIDNATGLLTDLRQDINVPAPVCLLFTSLPESGQ